MNNNEKLARLENQINLVRKNIQLLEKSKKTCSCKNQKPHYHQLLHYDSESGDEYLETSDVKHRQFIEKLERELERLSKRRKKVRAKK